MIQVNELLKRLNKKNSNGEIIPPSQQLDELARYLAENITNTQGDRDALAEVIYAGRQQICENIMINQQENHLNERQFEKFASNTANTELSKFIKDPVKTLVSKLRKTANGKETNEISQDHEHNSELENAQAHRDNAVSVRIEAERELETLEDEDKRAELIGKLELARINEAAAEQELNIVKNKIISESANDIVLDKVDANYRLAALLVEVEKEKYVEFIKDYNNQDLENDKLHLMEQLSEFEGEDPIQEAITNCNRKGFWEKTFRTTSNEYKTFSKMLGDRQKGLATRSQVDEAAKAYLIHKLPNYNGEGMPKPEDIAKLSGVGKDRAILAYKTLIANKDSRNYESRLTNLENIAHQNVYLSKQAKNSNYEPIKMVSGAAKDFEKERAINDISELYGNKKSEENVKEEDNKIEINELNKDDISLDK